MSKTLDKLSEFFSSPEVRSAIAEDAQDTGIGAASILDGLASTVGSFGNFIGGMEGTTRLQDAITGKKPPTKKPETFADAVESIILDAAIGEAGSTALKSPKAAPKA
jgi:hypothetical protein